MLLIKVFFILIDPHNWYTDEAMEDESQTEDPVYKVEEAEVDNEAEEEESSG